MFDDAFAHRPPRVRIDSRGRQPQSWPMACSPTSGRHARRARVAGAVVASVFSITDTAPLVAAAAQPAGPPGRWRQVWADEFEGPQGARPAPHWFFFDGWGKTRWRDAWYTTQDAFLDGQGHLVIRSRLDPADGGKAKTAYLQTYDWKVPQARWATFGPGSYIEARLNLAGLQARAQWAAFWLFDPSDTYDGDPANGTEIDVLEYVVIAGEGNAFHVANHWGPQGAAWGHEGRRIDASAYGIDLRAGGFHTFGLDWQRDRLRYYLDGKEVWTTTTGVSTSTGHALMLSIEISDGPANAWGQNDVFARDAALLPDAFVVDYVRVFAREP